MSFLTELRDLDIPESVIQKIHRNFGGNSFYVPKPNKPDLSQRNSQIYAKFNGKNFRQLSREFDLSAQHIHKIIKDERRKHQHDLFA